MREAKTCCRTTRRGQALDGLARSPRGWARALRAMRCVVNSPRAGPGRAVDARRRSASGPSRTGASGRQRAACARLAAPDRATGRERLRFAASTQACGRDPELSSSVSVARRARAINRHRAVSVRRDSRRRRFRTSARPLAGLSSCDIERLVRGASELGPPDQAHGRLLDSRDGLAPDPVCRRRCLSVVCHHGCVRAATSMPRARADYVLALVGYGPRQAFSKLTLAQASPCLERQSRTQASID